MVDPSTRYKLYYHPTSSASMRVTLYLRCRSVPVDLVELVQTGLSSDHRGIPQYSIPEGDAATLGLGSTELTALNPEGRVPVLLLPDGRRMTQTGPIIEFIEANLPADVGGAPLMPDDPWLRAEAARIMWIIAADTQPYQNIPFIIQAIGEWGMVKSDPTKHPLRLHFIRREFGAIEKLLAACSGRFAVGDSITVADCFLVPQIRNALLAEIDLEGEFPLLARVWRNMLAVPQVSQVLEEAGGVVQNFVFDEDKFTVYADDGTGRAET